MSEGRSEILWVMQAAGLERTELFTTLLRQVVMRTWAHLLCVIGPQALKRLQRHLAFQ